MGVTIKDVAREAGVSIASVSRALNGTGIVTDKIRVRVLEVAGRLRYVPHSGAQSLITRRTQTIGILLPDLYGEFFSELIRGIDNAARARNLHLLVSCSHEDAAQAAAALHSMSGRVDGLLVMSPHFDGKFLDERVRSTLPVVLMNTADPSRTRTALQIDNYGGSYAMVSHLTAHGYRRITHISGPDGNFDALERVRGYQDAMASELSGAEADLISGDFSEEAGYRAGREILARAKRPQAIFAANDMMAVGCLYAFMEAGVRVPQDIALAGFDDIPIARFVTPPLTTVRVKIVDLGGRALDRLAAMIAKPNELNASVETLPTELVIRTSCGTRAVAAVAAAAAATPRPAPASKKRVRE